MCIEFIGDKMVIGVPEFGTVAAAEHGKITIHKKVSNTFQLIQEIMPLQVSPNGRFGERFSGDGSRLVVLEPGWKDTGFAYGKVHLYEWTGALFELKGTITKEISNSENFKIGDYLAIEGDRVVCSLTDITDGDSQLYYYDWDVAGGGGEDSGQAFSVTEKKIQELLPGKSLKARNGFGGSAAIDGTRLVVGAWIDNTRGDKAGKVYVYEWNETTQQYDEISTLFASDAEIDDQFGASVALDGNRLVVGAHYDDTAGTDTGKVYVYEWNSTTQKYDEISTVFASDAEADDQFGNSTALDGNRLIVGAPLENTNGAGAGKVYVYEWDGNQYNEISTLFASDAQTGDRFGDRVALDGTRLAVGATLAGDDKQGKVYIYEWDGNQYNEISTLFALDAEFGDRFGVSVALDGNRLVVGAHNEDTAGTDTGKVYVYEWDGTEYVELYKILPSVGEQSMAFGHGVDLKNGRLFIGATYESGPAQNRDPNAIARGFVYDISETTGNYDLIQTIYATSDTFDSVYASGVAAYQDRLVVGAMGDSTKAYHAGKVYVYEWDGTKYNEISTLFASDVQSSDYFGSSVALDGNRLVVGSNGEDTKANNAGKVYIYEWDGNQYNEISTVFASDAQPGDVLGHAVAIDGNRLVVGAYGVSLNGEWGVGRVYTYVWNESTQKYDEINAFMQPGIQGRDRWGGHLDINNGRLVVGAVGDDDNGENSGKVYIYDWDDTTNSYLELMQLTPEDITTGSSFGSSVLLQNDILYVGSHGSVASEFTIEGYAGKVYVYIWNRETNKYDEIGQIKSNLLTPDHTFGRSLAVSGNRLIVGDNRDGIGWDGKAYVYEITFNTVGNTNLEISEQKIYDGGKYNEVSTLFASDAEALDWFGSSVALDGTRLVVGSYGEDTKGGQAGKVYVYEWDGNQYNEVSTLFASDAEADNYFGYSVALDGTRLVVGAIYESTKAYRAGKVYIYEWDGTQYNEISTLFASDAQTDALFGSDVALDGTRLVVGAAWESTKADRAGKVYVYEWDGNQYNEVSTLFASDAEAEDRFGYRFALEGTKLVVGAIDKNTKGNQAGKVYVYEWDGNQYNEVSTLFASDATAGDRFGFGVALDGTRLVVGAFREDTKAGDAGKVYIYEWDGNQYNEISTLVASDAEEEDLFGFGIALDGDRLVVGSIWEDTKGDKAGKVYVYDAEHTNFTSDSPSLGNLYGRSIAVRENRVAIGEQLGEQLSVETVEGPPVEISQLIASDGLFGESVALDGNRLVVGAYYDGSYETGKVYIYQWDGTQYNEISTLFASDAGAGDKFGSSVALDGTRLVVGATGEDTKATRAGKVYIYEWDGNQYNEISTVFASDAEYEDYFGSSVALDGNRLVVGAYGEDTAGNRAGKVYIYEWDGTKYNEISTVFASDAINLDYFGSSVALDGTRLVVGAYGEDTKAFNAGKVYVYEWDGTKYNEISTVFASDASDSDFFGYSIALDGTRLVVGSTGGFGNSKVYIYEWDGNQYNEISTVFASGGLFGLGGLFGSGVALDGNRLVVGARAENKVYVYNLETTQVTGVIDSGKVHIYDYDGQTYTKLTEVIAPTPVADDAFGISVALDTNKLYIGASGAEAYAENAGKVYEYDWNPVTNQYNFKREILKTANRAANNQFGLALAKEGNTLAIGHSDGITIINLLNNVQTEIPATVTYGISVTLTKDTSKLFIGQPHANTVLIYEKVSGVYQQTSTLTSSDAQPDDYYGASVSVTEDGKRLIVGAHLEDTAAQDAGKFYVYDWNGIKYLEVGMFTATPAEQSSGYGISSAISNTGDRLFVGAHMQNIFIDDMGIGDAGEVYVYDLTGGLVIQGGFNEFGPINLNLFPKNNSNKIIFQDNEIFVNSKNSAAHPEIQKLHHLLWNGASYQVNQTITAQEQQSNKSFAQNFVLSTDKNTLSITNISESDLGHVDSYTRANNTYSLDTSFGENIENRGNFAVGLARTNGRLITGDTTNGNILTFNESQYVAPPPAIGPNVELIFSEADDVELTGKDYNQVRFQLGMPYEDYMDIDKTPITSVLPQIDTENFLGDGKNLVVDFDSEEYEPITSDELVYSYDIKLNGFNIGVYRVFLSDEPFIEVILFVKGVGYQQGISQSDLEGGLKINIKYSSPNIKLVKNTIPRLRKVSFDR